MAAKKKTRKRQQTKAKKTAVKKMTPKKKAKKKPAAKSASSQRRLATKRKSVKKRQVVKTKSTVRKGIGAKTASPLREPVQPKSQTIDTFAFPREARGARSGQQSGDLQGLSSIEGPDSESVEELIEEGNAFEADVVAGVERAGNADEREVRTHEVPEDDVPGEYLDKD